jgi:hypothetical protein
MTTSSNDSSAPDPADSSATASSPESDSESSTSDVESTGGMAAGSEGSGGDVGYIDDSQLPEELRPDAEGMGDGTSTSHPSVGEGAGEEGGQSPPASPSAPGDDSDGDSEVSEPTA